MSKPHDDLDHLLARHPAGDVTAIRGDLKALAARYAERSADSGADGPWWSVWCAIQTRRKTTVSERLEELNSEQRRWFALWSFANRNDAEGIEAYRLYLIDPLPFGPLPGDNRSFYAAMQRLGRASEIPERVDAIRQLRESPDDQIVAVQTQLAAGNARAALTRLASIIDRYHDRGELWALRAIAERQVGNEGEAHDAAVQAAKMGLADEELQKTFLTALNLSRSEWTMMRRPYEPPDLATEMRRYRKDPGWQLVPSKAHAPHRYGGEPPMTMPPCAGCGRPIRAWFTIDVAQVPELRSRVPSWSILPLVSCIDCNVWMGRHDYRIDRAQESLDLLTVGIDTITYGEPMSEAAPIAAQFAALEPQPEIEDSDEEDLAGMEDEMGPLVGGEPLWVQNAVRVFCPRCREEMVYLAAMSTTVQFEPTIAINNESGFQYHFGCDACALLSVIAQWT